MSLDRDLRQRLESFLRPLYQDLDGASRFDEVVRIAAIARRLYDPDDRAFELLLLFRGLGRWLDKVGNLSRTVLSVGGLTEAELRRTAASMSARSSCSSLCAVRSGALFQSPISTDKVYSGVPSSCAAPEASSPMRTI